MDSGTNEYVEDRSPDGTPLAGENNTKKKWIIYG